MADAGGVVPSVKSDRAGGPWIELRGNWLHRIDIPECTLPLPFGYVCCVYHVHRPHLWGKTLLSPNVRWPGLLIIIAMQPPCLHFWRLTCCLLEHPTIPVGVISRLFGGAMYLAQAVEYSVQIGRTRSSSFEWLFPLTGFRASESGINCRILSIVAVNVALVLVAT